jgi:hypothetical protein
VVILPAQQQQQNLYDGTSWTNLQVWQQQERFGLAGTGTQAAALAFGGYTTANTTATEEWTGAGSPTTVTITAS